MPPDDAANSIALPFHLRKEARAWGGFAALLFACAVTLTGWLAPAVMVGDELTHYYMMRGQQEDWSRANFDARIPVQWTERGHHRRVYPHSNAWHALVAAVTQPFGGAVAAVQVVQGLFLLQFLAAGIALIRRERPADPLSARLWVCLAGSVPAVLLFSVLLYLDVPLAAQALTGFCLLRHGRWLLGAVFLGLGILVKESGLLFCPAYGALLLAQCRRGRDGWAGIIPPLVARGLAVLAIWGSAMWGMSSLMRSQGLVYHPAAVARAILGPWLPTPRAPRAREADSSPRPDTPLVDPGSYWNQPSHHPGDARDPVNLVMFLGPAALIGLLLALVRPHARGSAPPAGGGFGWAAGVGLSFALLAWPLLRHNPDIRFFLPAMPFLLLPVAARLAATLPARFCAPLLVAMCTLQSAAVLHKTWQLRRIDPATAEVIRFFREQAVPGAAVFGYPQGSSRLFPVRLHWYLFSGLNRFWTREPEDQMRVLAGEGVAWVLVEKARVDNRAPSEPHTGTFPSAYVRALRANPGVQPAFENRAYVVFRLPDFPADPATPASR